MCGAICGVSKGRYIKPIPITEAKVNWTDEDSGENLIPPKKYPCEHNKHWEWGKGSRNGQKLYFPTEEMFYQEWNLTDKEIKDAIKKYDMSSLEMKGRIICKDCAEKELAKVGDVQEKEAQIS